MFEVISKVIGVVLAFVLCIMAPLAITTTVNDSTDRRSIHAEMTMFVDGVVDSGKITQTTLADFYAGVNSYGPMCDIKIVKYTRVVNPTETTYIATDLDESVATAGMMFNKGDLIKVTIRAVNYPNAYKFARYMLGPILKPLSFSITARVR